MAQNNAILNEVFKRLDVTEETPNWCDWNSENKNNLNSFDSNIGRIRKANNRVGTYINTLSLWHRTMLF